MIKKISQGLDIKRGLKLVWESSRKWVYLNLVVTVLISIEPIIGLYLIKVLFDLLSQGVANQADVSVTTLSLLIALIATTEIFGLFITNSNNYITKAQGEKVQDYVLSKLHRKSIELDLSYYENPSYYDNLHLAQVEAPKKTAQFVSDISQVIQKSLSLAAVILLLVTYHWAIAILLIVAVLPGILVNFKSADKLYVWRTQATAREREAKYYHDLLTNSESAKEVRVFGFGSTIAEWFAKIRIQLRAEMLRIIYWEQTRSFAVNAFGSLGFYIGFFYFAYRTINGNFSMGDMALFYSAFYRAQGQLKSVIYGISSLYESNLFIGSLFKILEIEPSIKVNENAPKPAKEANSIEFRNVSFSYPGTERKAVIDFSLSIKAGEHVAIVGKNGSGKSTFVKLLCRLYDTSEGCILLNNTNIKEFHLKEYRKLYSVLFQDYLQLGLPVKDNIWLGDVDKSKDSKDVMEAAELSGGNELIQKLPDKYETVLGKVLKNGEQLSQGEWQKVALARALFRKANITILDEPTSWMDPEAEYEFFNKFHTMAKGKTSIMISHRLSSVKMVDKIIVLHEGRILEIGTHEELMSLKGKYATIFETQASSYRK